MSQANLFPPDLNSHRAASRRTDPQSSKTAARRIERSGTASNNRQRCLEAVRHQPGLTAAEIAQNVGLERHEPSRRLPELRKAGFVTNGPSRRCTVTGNNSTTWIPKTP